MVDLGNNTRVILTNAHVVAYGQVITVRKQGEADKYRARLLAISHQVDIAILTVSNYI